MCTGLILSILISIGLGLTVSPRYGGEIIAAFQAPVVVLAFGLWGYP